MRFHNYINENNYDFEKFYNRAKKKYGNPIPLGSFIGNCKAHDCDKNSFKHRKEYDLYKGELVPKERDFYDGTIISHIFNVDKKTGEVVEYTSIHPNLTEKEWKNNYFYFGNKLPKNIKLKDIWK